MEELRIHGIDEALARRIEDLAAAQQISLEEAAIRLLRLGAGLEEPSGCVGSALDDLMGTWSEEEADSFNASLRDLRRFDP